MRRHLAEFGLAAPCGFGLRPTQSLWFVGTKGRRDRPVRPRYPTLGGLIPRPARRDIAPAIPQEVALGYHGCFGTLNGWPSRQPPDLGGTVMLLNARLRPPVAASIACICRRSALRMMRFSRRSNDCGRPTRRFISAPSTICTMPTACAVSCLLRIGCLVWFDIGAALAVAVGVDHQCGPASRLGGVAGLVEHLGIKPTDDRPAATRPQRFVVVEAELQVVGLEAGVDEGVLHRLGVEHRQLAAAFL